MQEKIEEFANNLEGNITSIKIEAMPEYELELVSNVKENETKEEEILALVEESAEIKCRTYAIKLDGNEKGIVNTQEEAEAVVNEIKANTTEGVELNLEIEEQEKDKKDINPDTTTVEVAKTEINKDVEVKVQEYEKQQEELKQQEEKKKKEEAAKIAAAKKATSVSARGTATTRTAGASIPATGATFMRPVNGATITSKYGKRSSGFHTGTDFAIALGTPAYAAASGTVTFAGWKGSYGYLVIIDHGNGYQTYYAHCSALYVSAGQTVTQGQNISAVGSTGNSTGPHLHFEIRYNGNTLNPQNYV
jgi:murein DD-endopeptidase MepM/ murein hydrolase activator NlpD